MRALSLTCRALLVFLLSEAAHSDTTAPFLISENMRPRGCVLDCHRWRSRAVCGSNGRLYKSLCAFQRAQCINTQLRLAPRTHCSDPSQSKCQLVRTLALESSRGGRGGPAASVFVPECHPDGHFLPVQCHGRTGFCWCSTPDGKPLSPTSALHLIPDCTDLITKLAQITDDDSAQVQDDADEPGPTSDPRKPAELTAPPFLVTILMNSDPKGNRSVRRPTDGPQTCERERASLLSRMRSARQEERFVPECTADGRYSPVQCHAAIGYCWCVRADSGRLLPGTSSKNHIPDCTGAEDAPADGRDKPLPGCPGAQKKQFLQSLVRALQLEAEHAGSLSPLQSSNTSASPPVNTSTSATPSTSSLALDAGSPAAPDAVESPGPEGALRWHFARLDVDSSGVLSEREARPLRQFLRRRLRPRRCAKKFAQYCDRDGDRGLTLGELRVCLGF